MDINRLREFLVLSEHLNYSKAANLLYITQPVLSRHIHDLEELFGGQLFLRDTHKVELTEFGSICAEQLREVIKAYDSALINISKASDTSNESLTVGFLDYAVRPFLNQFVAWFEAAYPDIEIDYRSGNLDDLTEALMDDQIDLAFLIYITSDSINSKELESEFVYEDNILAVFSPAHQSGKKKSITIEELSIYPQIAFSKSDNPYVSSFNRDLFESRNLQINIVKEVSSFESGLFYAKTGIGAFILPQHLSSIADDLNTVPITNDDCKIPINLVWKGKNPKQSLQTYVHEFKLFYRGLRYTKEA